VPLDGTEPENLFDYSLRLPATGDGPTGVWTEVASARPSLDGTLLVNGALKSDVQASAGSLVRAGTRGGSRLDVLRSPESRPDLDPIATSPDGRRVACLTSGNRRPARWDLTIVNADDFGAGKTFAARLLGPGPQPPPVRPAAHATLPMAVADWATTIRSGPLDIELALYEPYEYFGSRISSIDWKRYGSREWIALAEANDTARRVFFVDPDAPAPAPPVVRTLPDREFRYPESNDWARLVRNPDGLLVLATDRILLYPLPPSEETPREWPLRLPGGQPASGVEMRIPPFGGVAFVLGCQEGDRPGEGTHHLYCLDLTTGRTEVLVGPGGLLPRAVYVLGIEASPIPDPR
jgi:hypothetical protein